MGNATMPRLDRNGKPNVEGPGERIALGDREYVVFPQKIGRLRSKLGLEFHNLTALADELGGEGTGLNDFLETSLERAYRLLKVLIPDLMPLHEFLGYGTEAAQEAGEYHEESDVGPDFPQIVHAFEVTLRVNRLDLFGHLKGLFDPDLIRAYANRTMLDVMMPQETEEETTGTSASSSATPGPDTPQTTSSTPPQTPSLPEGSEDSPSLD
jgi:hypothetical protein